VVSVATRGDEVDKLELGQVKAQAQLVCAGEHLGKPQRMEFLWVRWFGRDMTHIGGWKTRRLHRVGFLDAADPDSGAFGFLDPTEVLRAAHLIPAFHFGWTSEYLGASVAHIFHGDKQQDYVYYYVNQ
jgi:hypothetical protein